VAFTNAAACDTNFDGLVEMIDVESILSAGKNQASSWSQGDFNYDRLGDVLDIAAFNATYLYEAGPYNTPMALAVPEPATWAAAIAGFASSGYALLRRRRHR
jgi:hypothetical protein